MASHFLLLFGLFIVTTFYGQVLSTLPYSLIRDHESNKLYLLFKKTNIARLLPDDQVAIFLELKPSEAKVVNDMSSYTISDPAPAFTLPPPNPDTAIANMLARVNLLCPQTFWKKKQLVNLFNPALVRWKDRYLIAYRNGTDISLAWMQHHAHDDSFELLFNDFSHGLRDSYGRSPWNFSVGKYNFHEDPRLLALHGGKQISLTFVRLREARDTAEIAYINITMPARHSTASSGPSWVQSQHKGNTASQVSFSPETVLLTGRKQKNWTPFEHQGEQYWITSINPLHIVKHASTVYDPTNSDPLQAKMTTVYQSRVDIPLTWSASYGLPIRGGTPAIKVRGLYMAFFHTLSSFQTPWRLLTYFMGAVTFCPNFPFQMHSISRHPILQDFLYQGPWLNNHRDYVVFPAGIAVDDDEKYLYLSFGHQDARGYIAKFDIDELLPTLEIVTLCSMNGTISYDFS